MKTMRGFTLIELMVIVAVIGILAAYAIPNVREMTAANRQLATVNAIVSSFNHARNSAITLSRDVQIEAKDGDWKKGWTVKALQYKAMDVTGNIHEYPEETLLAHDPVPNQMQMAAAVTTLQYDRQGRLSIISTKSITVCDDRAGEKGRTITLEPIGRVSITSVDCS